VALGAEEPLGIGGKSPTFRQLIDLARRVAKVDSTVLITGESGSGKERIARLAAGPPTTVRRPSERAGMPSVLPLRSGGRIRPH
jgi:DNA-binding NtrC family response regulator